MSYPNSDALLEEARRETGLSDFGSNSFRTGLDVLLSSLGRDARLTEEGQQRTLVWIRRRLKNRLLIESWLKEHPDVLEAPIAGPVCVTGLERTGTTALGNMLSLDDQFRSLRGWEQADPVPPPVLEGEENDRRRVQSQVDIDRIHRERPEMAAMHIREVDASTEDTEVLGLEFAAQQMTLPIFSYFDWWRDADATPVFEYHARVTRLLQSRRPPNLWLFKAPHHRFHLEALVSAYPNARFIMTHRDPAKVVPSYVSLVTSIYPPGTMDRHDPKAIGPLISKHMRIGAERAIEARQRIGEDRFLDVHHREFVSDPFGVLERAYDFLGLEFRPQVRAAMERWQQVNRSGAHGAHRYTAEQFGLSADRIRADFDAYIRRYDVQIEG